MVLVSRANHVEGHLILNVCQLDAAFLLHYTCTHKYIFNCQTTRTRPRDTTLARFVCFAVSQKKKTTDTSRRCLKAHNHPSDNKGAKAVRLTFTLGTLLKTFSKLEMAPLNKTKKGFELEPTTQTPSPKKGKTEKQGKAHPKPPLTGRANVFRPCWLPLLCLAIRSPRSTCVPDGCGQCSHSRALS